MIQPVQLRLTSVEPYDELLPCRDMLCFCEEEEEMGVPSTGSFTALLLRDLCSWSV